MLQVQDECSTSWYNLAEVNEVIERVSELYESWPVEWGQRDSKSILVTTAYSDQVHYYLSFLRLSVAIIIATNCSCVSYAVHLTKSFH